MKVCHHQRRKTLANELRHKTRVPLVNTLATLGALLFSANAQADIAQDIEFTSEAIASYSEGGQREGPFLRLQAGVNAIWVNDDSIYWGLRSQFEFQREWFKESLSEGGDEFPVNEDPALYTAYGFFGNSRWGDLVAGRIVGAAAELTYTAPSALGGAYGVNFPFLIHADTLGFAPFSPTSAAAFYERSLKIGYYSPDRVGWRLGFSWAPKDNEPESTLPYKLDNQVEIALALKTTLLGLTTNMTFGLYTAEVSELPNGFLDRFFDDPIALSYGLNLNRGGITLGGSVVYSENFLGSRDVNFESWTAGATWRIGAFVIGTSAGEAVTLLERGNVNNAAQGDRRSQLKEVGVSWSACPGLGICPSDTGIVIGTGWVSVVRRDRSRVIATNDLEQDEDYGVLQVTITP